MIVDEIKTRLGITGTEQDVLLTAYSNDVKVFMENAGVPNSVIESDKVYGVISKGVADLWNLGSGDGQFSTQFQQMVIQFAVGGEDVQA